MTGGWALPTRKLHGGLRMAIGMMTTIYANR